MSDFITLNISESSLKAMIIEFLDKQGYSVAEGDIHFDVSRRSVGYGPGEHDEFYFKGCRADIKTNFLKGDKNENNKLK